MHGLGVYVRSNLPIARELSLEDINESYVFPFSTTYIFVLYRSLPSASSTVIDAVSCNIEKALRIQPSANIMICP